MKVFAVVLVAIIGFANAGYAPIVLKSYSPAITQYSSLPVDSYIYRSAPLAYSYDTPLTYAAPLAYSAPWTYTAPTVYKSAPVILKEAPALVSTIPGEAKYTAINRGALHEAPLPGHTLSQTSVNIEPAEGTF